MLGEVGGDGDEGELQVKSGKFGNSISFAQARSCSESAVTAVSALKSGY
jgi:hypothetical protein